jgi:hypothetical protein
LKHDSKHYKVLMVPKRKPIMQESAEYQVLKQTNITVKNDYDLAIAEAINIAGKNKRLKGFDAARKKLNRDLSNANDLYQKTIRRGVL